MIPTDYIQRFHFQNSAIRGAVVKLSNSFIEALNGHDYPNAINALLGECLAACTLMGSNLKVSSQLTLQARGSGPISLLMAESVLNLSRTENGDANNPDQPRQSIRAYARSDSQKFAALANMTKPSSLNQLLGKAQLALTIETQGAKRYQSIVELAENSLERCLEGYFLQSEQLPTFLKLSTTDTVAAGILLQQMPSASVHIDSTSNSPQTQLDWQELTVLASSLKHTELCQLPAKDSLHRLFHQHNYQLSQPQAVVFSCSCSAQRTAFALLQLGQNELQEMLDSEGEILIDCEFCSARYRYNQQAIDQLHAGQGKTQH